MSLPGSLLQETTQDGSGRSWEYPPTAFIYMARDQRTARGVAEMTKVLAQKVGQWACSWSHVAILIIENCCLFKYMQCTPDRLILSNFNQPIDVHRLMIILNAWLNLVGACLARVLLAVVCMHVLGVF